MLSDSRRSESSSNPCSMNSFIIRPSCYVYYRCSGSLLTPSDFVPSPCTLEVGEVVPSDFQRICRSTTFNCKPQKLWFQLTWSDSLDVDWKTISVGFFLPFVYQHFQNPRLWGKQQRPFQMHMCPKICQVRLNQWQTQDVWEKFEGHHCWKGTLKGTLCLIYHRGIQEGTFAAFFSKLQWLFSLVAPVCLIFSSFKKYQ